VYVFKNTVGVKVSLNKLGRRQFSEKGDVSHIADMYQTFITTTNNKDCFTRTWTLTLNIFYFATKLTKGIIGLIYDDPHPGKFMTEFGKTD
jgi:hypothetical protein